MQMTFSDALGGRFCFSADEYFTLLRQRPTQGYLLCVFVLLVAMDAPRLLGTVSMLTLLGIWAVAMSCFILLHGVAFRVAEILHGWLPEGRIKRMPVPHSIVALMALLPSVFISESLTELGAGGAYKSLFFTHFFFYFIITETLILVFMRFVRPAIEAKMASDQVSGPASGVVSGPISEPPRAQVQMAPGAALVPAPKDIDTSVPQVAAGQDLGERTMPPGEGTFPPGAIDRRVVIGAEPIPLEHLRHIQAREHHVHVTLAGSDLIQRARLADIVAQTGPQDGIQPHRSWWVAAHAAKTLERDGQKHVLTLHDGTKVPVARSRLDAVRDWMAHHDPQVVDQSGV